MPGVDVEVSRLPDGPAREFRKELVRCALRCADEAYLRELGNIDYVTAIVAAVGRWLESADEVPEPPWQTVPDQNGKAVRAISAIHRAAAAPTATATAELVTAAMSTLGWQASELELQARWQRALAGALAAGGPATPHPMAAGWVRRRKTAEDPLAFIGQSGDLEPAQLLQWFRSCVETLLPPVIRLANVLAGPVMPPTHPVVRVISSAKAFSRGAGVAQVPYPVVYPSLRSKGGFPYELDYILRSLHDLCQAGVWLPAILRDVRAYIEARCDTNLKLPQALVFAAGAEISQLKGALGIITRRVIYRFEPSGVRPNDDRPWHQVLASARDDLAFHDAAQVATADPRVETAPRGQPATAVEIVGSSAGLGPGPRAVSAVWMKRALRIIADHMRDLWRLVYPEELELAPAGAWQAMPAVPAPPRVPRRRWPTDVVPALEHAYHAWELSLVAMATLDHDGGGGLEGHRSPSAATLRAVSGLLVRALEAHESALRLTSPAVDVTPGYDRPPEEIGQLGGLLDRPEFRYSREWFERDFPATAETVRRTDIALLLYCARPGRAIAFWRTVLGQLLHHLAGMGRHPSYLDRIQTALSEMDRPPTEFELARLSEILRAEQDPRHMQLSQLAYATAMAWRSVTEWTRVPAEQPDFRGTSVGAYVPGGFCAEGFASEPFRAEALRTIVHLTRGLGLPGQWLVQMWETDSLAGGPFVRRGGLDVPPIRRTPRLRWQRHVTAAASTSTELVHEVDDVWVSEFGIVVPTIVWEPAGFYDAGYYTRDSYFDLLDPLTGALIRRVDTGVVEVRGRTVLTCGNGWRATVKAFDLESGEQVARPPGTPATVRAYYNSYNTPAPTAQRQAVSGDLIYRIDAEALRADDSVTGNTQWALPLTQAHECAAPPQPQPVAPCEIKVMIPAPQQLYLVTRCGTVSRLDQPEPAATD